MLQVTSVQKSGLTASSFLSILKTQSDKLRHTLLKSKSTPSTKIKFVAQNILFSHLFNY
jgi:hypothetical protein